MQNTRLKDAVVSFLNDNSCVEICLCPGARNAPFVKHFDQKKGVWLWPDERAAAFFALGRSKRSKRPVAVITTSGTAAAELLPACMEGYYSGVPLLLITCDRPVSMRYSGAPQTCIQPWLFGPYVEGCLDLSSAEDLLAYEWNKRSPFHLNVCFGEPL